MKKQHLTETACIQDLQSKMKEMHDILAQETAMRDQLRTVVHLQRKKLTSKVDAYQKSILQYDRAILMVNDSVKGPQQVKYRQMTGGSWATWTSELPKYHI